MNRIVQEYKFSKSRYSNLKNGKNGYEKFKNDQQIIMGLLTKLGLLVNFELIWTYIHEMF